MKMAQLNKTKIERVPPEEKLVSFVMGGLYEDLTTGEVYIAMHLNGAEYLVALRRGTWDRFSELVSTGELEYLPYGTVVSIVQGK